MQLLELGTNTVLIDFTDSEKLYDFTPRFFDANSQSYRRDGEELVSNDSKTYKAELTFEFRQLTQADVDTLQANYRGREPFICVPDSVDDAEDALFSYLNKKYPETDYTIHVRESRWLQPAELFASEHIRKWGRNRRSGSFDSNSKIWYNRLGFRGRGQRHRSVVSPTSHCPGMKARKPNPMKTCKYTRLIYIGVAGGCFF